MASVNMAIIVGNLGSAPDLKNVGDRKVCNFSVATNESWTDKSGNKQERVEWHRIVVWGNQADPCAKYLDKGSPVYVEGRIQTRTWDDDQGVKRYMTEIVARDVKFLGSKDGGGKSEDRDKGRGDEPPPRGAADADDIPF